MWEELVGHMQAFTEKVWVNGVRVLSLFVDVVGIIDVCLDHFSVGT